MELSVNFEKLYFAFILSRPEYFSRVEPYFFKAQEIQLVFSVVKDEYKNHPTDGVPKVKRIVELVRLNDKKKLIKGEVLKSLLTVNLDEYSPDGKDDSKHAWLEKRVQAWITFNTVQSGLAESIDYIRNIDQLDHDNVMDVASKIRSIIGTSSLISFGEESLGSSFDDLEAHIQDEATEKVTTGWPCLDNILNKGWDIKTLNVFMGETNSGKSLWLQNIAINAANAGKNVIYFSLEMSEKKVMKRLGAMRLRIPINEYEDTAKNKEYMQERLVKMRKSIASNNGNAFDKKLGKIYVKEFPAGQATISDFDNYCKKWEEKYDEKIDMIIVDYITIMAPERGLQLENNLYMKGKHLAEGLRSLGYKYESPVVTAIQVGKDAWSANDINLASVPESKAIPETADTFWGIIRSPEMKRLNLYRLKALKLRDGNFEKDQVMFDLNPKYLCIENDRYNETD
jgi:replicative DNA helicase